MQLSFILFLRLLSFSSLETHKSILSLLSRSATTLLSSSSYDQLISYFPSTEKTIIKKLLNLDRMIGFYTNFIEVISGQLEALPDDVWTEDSQGPGMEEFWISELDVLYQGVASATRVSSSGKNGMGYGYGYGASSSLWADYQPLKEKLEDLRNLTKKRFGWDLIQVEEYNRLIVEQEMMDEETGYIEEGEDAPVIVEV